MHTMDDCEYEYPERHGFTYVIYSTENDRPEEVLVWCETDTFWKADIAFAILKFYREKLRIDHVTLINEDTGTVLRYDGTR
ncbi:MAG TPA: hypothetical protein VHD95_12730 [Rhizomicrobium sp.]|nr:hypothetical protein [Rhizomicrobium sp.]